MSPSEKSLDMAKSFTDSPDEKKIELFIVRTVK